METSIVSLGYIAAAVAGAGVLKIAEDWKAGLYILGVAVLILIVKAIMNRFGIPVAR